MTEYDYSPEAYERYLATQARIARWVDNTEQHAHEFRAPGVPPLAHTGRQGQSGAARTRRNSFVGTSKSRRSSGPAPTMSRHSTRPTAYAPEPGPMPTPTHATKTHRSRRHSISPTHRSRTFHNAPSDDESTLYSPSEVMERNAAKAGPPPALPLHPMANYMFQSPPPSPLASPMPSAPFPFPGVSQQYSYPYVVPPTPMYGAPQQPATYVIVPPKGKSLKVYVSFLLDGQRVASDSCLVHITHLHTLQYLLQLLRDGLTSCRFGFRYQSSLLQRQRQWNPSGFALFGPSSDIEQKLLTTVLTTVSTSCCITLHGLITIMLLKVYIKAIR